MRGKTVSQGVHCNSLRDFCTSTAVSYSPLQISPRKRYALFEITGLDIGTVISFLQILRVASFRKANESKLHWKLCTGLFVMPAAISDPGEKARSGRLPGGPVIRLSDFC